jgi:xanthosine utilization system XapX-like protein
MLLMALQQLLLLPQVVRLLQQQRPMPQAMQGVALVGLLTCSSLVPLVKQSRADLLLLCSIKQKGMSTLRELLRNSFW